MADYTKDEAQSTESGISKTVSDLPPSHYIIKVQSVSLLSKNGIDQYTSDKFESGGYKWKLVFYPSGNKNKNVKDHISVYVRIVDTGNNLHPGWEVHVIIRLFLYDQKKDNFYVVQEEKARRFRAMKKEWGHEKFMHSTTFYDASNGYVVDDVCVFGAEVYVTKEIRFPGKDSLTMIKDPVVDKKTYKIVEFSNLRNEYYYSEPFCQHWKLLIYPRGKGSGAGSHLSIYLALANPSNTTQIYAEFTFRLIHQFNNKHYPSYDNYTGRSWFNATNKIEGWERFISFQEFSKSGSGLLVRDTCIIEAEVQVLALSNAADLTN